MTPYYQADGVTIYNADAFDVLHTLQGIGAVVTDPPYSSGGMFRGDRSQSTVTKYVQTGTITYRPEFAGDTRDQRAFLVWCSMWAQAAFHASEEGATLCAFIDWRQLPTLTDAIQCGGWNWRNLATWWKPGCRMQRGRFSASAEYVVYATKGQPSKDVEQSPQNVFRCKVESDREVIAQKPEAVVRWVFGTVAPNALILDPFMGSGTILRVAKDLGHEAIGIDVDEQCCEIAARRLQQQVLLKA